MSACSVDHISSWPWYVAHINMRLLSEGTSTPGRPLFFLHSTWFTSLSLCSENGTKTAGLMMRRPTPTCLQPTGATRTRKTRERTLNGITSSSKSLGSIKERPHAGVIIPTAGALVLLARHALVLLGSLVLLLVMLVAEKKREGQCMWCPNLSLTLAVDLAQEGTGQVRGGVED